MKPILRAIPYVDIVAASEPLRDTPMTLVLHGTGERGRWSFLAANPAERIEAKADGAKEALERARLLTRTIAAETSPALPPFIGGVAGLVGYDSARAFETAPQFDPPDDTPDLLLGLYDCVAAFDHGARRAYVVAWDLFDDAQAAHAKADALAAALAHARPSAPPRSGDGTLIHATPIADYEKMTATVIARVRAGDLYQANVARRYETLLGAGDHPYTLFQRLCTQSPAPFCAYMRLDRHAIVSNSPERFLSVTRRDGALVATTKPIKGTRPRGRTPTQDRANAQALIESEKDRAENLMIVDLMRNDLSKVCAPGSVRAPTLFALESYVNVHHLVSEVEGVLAHDKTAFDVFAAAFPPGSITGAPKVKAMELIGALEGKGRGPYCGSLAWFGFDGAMDSSVLIRTATCTQDGAAWRVSFSVGAGIVADSDPAEEARETIAKAAALKRAIIGHEDEP